MEIELQGDALGAYLYGWWGDIVFVYKEDLPEIVEDYIAENYPGHLSEYKADGITFDDLKIEAIEAFCYSHDMPASEEYAMLCAVKNETPNKNKKLC